LSPNASAVEWRKVIASVAVDTSDTEVRHKPLRRRQRVKRKEIAFIMVYALSKELG
jgi:hypothetical protein